MKWSFLQKCFGCVLHDFERWVICKTFFFERKNVRFYLWVGFVYEVGFVHKVSQCLVKWTEIFYANFLILLKKHLSNLSEFFFATTFSHITDKQPHTMQQRSLPCMTNVSCANIELIRNRVLLKKFAKNKQNLSGAINPSFACFVLLLSSCSRKSRTCRCEEFAKGDWRHLDLKDPVNELVKFGFGQTRRATNRRNCVASIFAPGHTSLLRCQEQIILISCSGVTKVGRFP